MSPARNSSISTSGPARRSQAPSRVSGRARPCSIAQISGGRRPVETTPTTATGRLRQRPDDGVERGGEQHGAVADDGHAAVVVDGGGARQAVVVGLPVEQVAVGGAAEQIVDLRLEPLDRPVHGDPVQARERVVVVRERLARRGTAATRRARRRSPRRARTARPGAPARRRRWAPGARPSGRGGRRRDPGRRGRRPSRRRARRAAARPTTGPTSGAAASPPVRETTCRWAGCSVSPAPS